MDNTEIKAWDLLSYSNRYIHVNFTIWVSRMDADKAYSEKAKQELPKNATSYIEQIMEATSHKTATV